MNLAKTFYFHVADRDEVLVMLARHFNRGEIHHDKRILTRDGSDESLSISFSKKGNVTLVTPGGHLTEETIQHLSTLIRSTLVEGQVPKVGWSIAFSWQKVEGAYLGKGFALMPMPPEAPSVPPYTIGTHPFLLGTTFISSPDVHINMTRLAKRGTETARLLNLFLLRRISLRDNLHREAWVVRINQDNSSTVEWLNLGYWFSLPGPSDDFGNLSSVSQMKVLPGPEYYSEIGLGLRPGEPLKVPENLPALMELATSLPPKAASSFWMSVTWMDIADRIGRESSSAGYVALVSAIESLMDKSSGRCSECGQLRYSLTKKFADFLRKYGTADGLPDDIRDLVEVYYHRRSGLTHGTELMASDVKPWSFFAQESFAQDDMHRDLRGYVRMAIINWLLDRSSSPTELLSSG